MRVSLRPLAREHLGQVAEIERACFNNPWPRSLFMEELCMPMSMDWVALVGNRVAAFCCMWLVSTQVKVQNIAVHPDFQHKGLGRYLLLSCLAMAREQGARQASLEVRTGNIAALSLYYSLGFCLVKRIAGYYYPEGEDALLLWRDL
ncbi:MAG: ribosomal protein S18-alanine N-acetyltransferase [Deltaproteobacteria bacterium]|nr:ribosomal protein S18-alanine N-acetyltransferase [Deltaproteobacteria bacterium]